MQSSGVALLLIDVINHFDFPQGEALLRRALKIAPQLAKLTRRARHAGVPVIYVNDNFGEWHSNASQLLGDCVRLEARGRAFVQAICPDQADYFLLKPMHSAFYQAPLDLLLRHLGVHTLIFCGLTTNNCILCSAHDAKMRELEIIVARDCCTANTQPEHDQALHHLKHVVEARVLAAASIDFNEFKTARRSA